MEIPRKAMGSCIDSAIPKSEVTSRNGYYVVAEATLLKQNESCIFEKDDSHERLTIAKIRKIP
ncbi:cyclomaltodextrinase [Aphanothece sacrum FPU1]|uniref:Cyclomaltodextrinase n=1 Tax=Aphanothece sacrum FPU1 TaxID=1920663 RepID=A0A401IBM3_APHSA|nr:cyclomaltodextrinase [Aphanothece sacrum FPU1]GBF84967.1 cyclomaltodextrinase [Aphanothece sacrum FPU3]